MNTRDNIYVAQEAEGKKLDFNNESFIKKEELKCFVFEDRDQLITIETNEFQAVCPFSGLPDVANIIIQYKAKGNLALELKALKYYFLSYRSVGIYQEKVTSTIYSDLTETLNTDSLKITTKYNVRGGMYVTCEKGTV